MSRITPGNRLYLYQLLSRELGIGRQTAVVRVEEVLAADDILPSDLECADVRELLENLDFVRLTVFKKGRVYATIMVSPDCDEMLARNASTGEERKAASGRSGRKSWKRKRADKTVRPAKPRPRNRPEMMKPSPQDLKEDRGEIKEPLPTTGTEAPEPASVEVNEERAPIMAAVTDEASQPEDEMPEAAQDQALETEVPAQPIPQDEVGPSLQESLTIISQPAPKDEAQPDQPSPEATPVDEAPSEDGDEAHPAEPAREDAGPAEAVSTTISSESEPQQLSEEGPSDAEGVQAPPPTPDAEGEKVSLPTSEALDETSVPAATSAPLISLTITYDPYAYAYDPLGLYTPLENRLPEEPDGGSDEITQEPCPPETPKEVVVAPEPTEVLPKSIVQDVRCPNETLSTLYQILPFDVEPLSLLEEDWRVARSTKAYANEAGVLSYDLRYLVEPNGRNVTVRMRRRQRSATGKRWELISVGEPGMDLATVGFDGLPAEDGGAWSELSAELPPRGFTVPERQLALFADLGPWDALLEELAGLSAPEEWGASHQILREYLCLTFARLMREDKVICLTDEGRALFDTGLLSPSGERVFMGFSVQTGSTPWRFTGFTCEAPEPLPEPVSYINSLADITLAPPYEVTIHPRLMRAHGEAIRSAVEHALNRTRRNYRLATPAYDPCANELRLLLPLSQPGDEVSGALVLHTMEEGHYQAVSVLPLDRARVCGRVITQELPQWMCEPLLSARPAVGADQLAVDTDGIEHAVEGLEVE